MVEALALRPLVPSRLECSQSTRLHIADWVLRAQRSFCMSIHGTHMQSAATVCPVDVVGCALHIASAHVFSRYCMKD